MRQRLTVLVLAAASLALAGLAHARGEVTDCTASEAACVLDAAWSAALNLPDEKRQRLAPVFVEFAARAGGPDLMQAWADRLSQPAAGTVQDPAGYPDFGWTSARPVLDSHGVDGLIRFAREKRAPLQYGRSDALLSAGKHLHGERPAEALHLNQALLDLADAASDFEKPELTSAAQELAMYRCDLAMFDRATSTARKPLNLRQAFWRARISGGALDLLERVRAEADSEDTRHVRQVLDGYGAIVQLGYCQAS